MCEAECDVPGKIRAVVFEGEEKRPKSTNPISDTLLEASMSGGTVTMKYSESEQRRYVWLLGSYLCRRSGKLKFKVTYHAERWWSLGSLPNREVLVSFAGAARGSVSIGDSAGTKSVEPEIDVYAGHRYSFNVSSNFAGRCIKNGDYITIEISDPISGVEDIMSCASDGCWNGNKVETDCLSDEEFAIGRGGCNVRGVIQSVFFAASGQTIKDFDNPSREWINAYMSDGVLTCVFFPSANGYVWLSGSLLCRTPGTFTMKVTYYGAYREGYYNRTVVGIFDGEFFGSVSLSAGMSTKSFEKSFDLHAGYQYPFNISKVFDRSGILGAKDWIKIEITGPDLSVGDIKSCQSDGCWNGYKVKHDCLPSATFTPSSAFNQSGVFRESEFISQSQTFIASSNFEWSQKLAR